MTIEEFIEARIGTMDEEIATAVALRSILRLHRSEETGDTPPYLVCRHDQVAQSAGLYPCGTVRRIAAIWSDHPDYRPEWAPTAV